VGAERERAKVNKSFMVFFLSRESLNLFFFSQISADSRISNNSKILPSYLESEEERMAIKLLLLLL
jgi:hypothetical protein